MVLQRKVLCLSRWKGWLGCDICGSILVPFLIRHDRSIIFCRPNHLLAGEDAWIYKIQSTILLGFRIRELTLVRVSQKERNQASYKTTEIVRNHVKEDRDDQERREPDTEPRRTRPERIRTSRQGLRRPLTRRNSSKQTQTKLTGMRPHPRIFSQGQAHPQYIQTGFPHSKFCSRLLPPTCVSITSRKRALELIAYGFLL